MANRVSYAQNGINGRWWINSCIVIPVHRAHPSSLACMLTSAFTLFGKLTTHTSLVPSLHPANFSTLHVGYAMSPCSLVGSLEEQSVTQIYLAMFFFNWETQMNYFSMKSKRNPSRKTKALGWYFSPCSRLNWKRSVCHADFWPTLFPQSNGWLGTSLGSFRLGHKCLFLSHNEI